MARPVKCPVCNSFFDRDKCEWEQHKKRYYHKDCFLKMQKEEEDKKKLKLQMKATSKVKPINELHRYICNLYGYEKMPARVIIQINQMKKDYEFTDNGILKTLQYFYEIKEGNKSRGNGGIGIVPYVYEEAKKYYYQLYLAQESNKDKKFKDMVTQGDNITISPPVKKTKGIKEINIVLGENENEK